VGDAVDFDDLAEREALREELDRFLRRRIGGANPWACLLAVGRRDESGSRSAQIVMGNLDGQSPLWAWRGLLVALNTAMERLLNIYRLPEDVAEMTPVAPKRK
jgi:hypothetical protein